MNRNIKLVILRRGRGIRFKYYYKNMKIAEGPYCKVVKRRAILTEQWQ